jgi:molybdate transport system substrate-binding protein
MKKTISKGFRKEAAIDDFRIIAISAFLLLSLLHSACNPASKSDNEKENRISVFAAAGARAITGEMCDIFESVSNKKISRNYASSGILARQIKGGADADIFISANYEWIKHLIDERIVSENSVWKIASTSLVVVAPQNSEIKCPEFSNDYDILSSIEGNIAMGDPGHVPAGKYSKMVLDSLKWYNTIKDRLVLAKDVSSVLRYVETGSCELGFVYFSEAIQSSKLKLIAEVPAELYTPIFFYIALTRSASDGSEELVEYFLSSKVKALYTENGFEIVE